MKKFNIPYDIEEVEDRGNWLKNTSYKSEFIRKKLDKYDRLVWIDADATIEKYPVLFDLIEEDFAANYEYLKKLISATLLFKRTDYILKVVDSWVTKSKANFDKLEQVHLQDSINGYYTEAHKITVFYLPDSYCCLDGLTYCEPVIAQHQASRKFRNADIRAIFNKFNP